MSDRRRDPSELTPRDAVERYLNRRGADATESSREAWWYRLRLWIVWCDGRGIESVGDLDTLDIDEYYEHRASRIAPITLQGEMTTLRQLLRYCADLGAVDDGLPEAVRVPSVSAEDIKSEEKLASDAAEALLAHYRTTSDVTGTRGHALLELAWLTGARIGGLRGLDVQDVDLEEAFVEFRHRPETDTPLKNKLDGERAVALPDVACRVIESYLDRSRIRVRDDNGRAPLLTSSSGRASASAIRGWTYVATEPCIHDPCPHGKDRPTCEWTAYTHASKCPSSRSPHRVRTGAITWMLNRGMPPEVVAHRVNSDVSTIERHYDVADLQERRRRERQRLASRRQYIDQLQINDNQ